jgi:hypothetical protein
MQLFCSLVAAVTAPEPAAKISSAKISVAGMQLAVLNKLNFRIERSS